MKEADGAEYAEAKANLLYTSLFMIFLELLFANLQNLYTYNFYLIGMKVRVTLSSLIYRKVMCFSVFIPI